MARRPARPVLTAEQKADADRIHAALLEAMCRTGADVVSLGAQHDLAAARKAYPHLVFQGNVNEEVLRTGTPETVRGAVRACLAAGGGARHIVNLNHGVDKGTPVANFEAYVNAAKGM